MPPRAQESASADIALFRRHCRDLSSRRAWNGRLTLVQLPQNSPATFDREVALARGCYAFPPTGLQCLVQALAGGDVETRILDLNLEMLRRARADAAYDPASWTVPLEEHLAAHDPCVVGVSCMFDSGIEPLTTVLDLLRRGGRVVLAGGVIPTYEWKSLLGRGLCDVIVRGEGEDRLPAVLAALAGAPDSPVPADICFAREGRLHRTEGPRSPAAPHGDMTAGNEAVPLEDYFRHGGLNPFSRMAGTPFAAIQMSRGCRARCRFCSVPDFMGRGVRTRTPEAVFAEMEYLATRHGVRHFEWLDDDLLLPRRQVHSLMRTIARAGLGITWSASNGLVARSLDEETLALMRDSGCLGFRVGVETGNAARLAEIGKPGNLDEFRAMAVRLRGFPEMFVCINIMLGFPGETFADMMDSYRLSRQLDLDWTGFTTCQAVRGADMFEAFEDAFESQMAARGAPPPNYIPVRESASGELKTASDTKRNLEVFALPPRAVPSPEQVKEIWFTFNLVGNFLDNPNLRPGGRVGKFIRWVSAVQATYPHNPKLALFLGLGHVIASEPEAAARQWPLARRGAGNPYWADRFAHFGLRDIMDSPPRTASDAFEAIARARRQAARHEGTR